MFKKRNSDSGDLSIVDVARGKLWETGLEWSVLGSTLRIRFGMVPLKGYEQRKGKTKLTRHGKMEDRTAPSIDGQSQSTGGLHCEAKSWQCASFRKCFFVLQINLDYYEPGCYFPPPGVSKQ